MVEIEAEVGVGRAAWLGLAGCWDWSDCSSCNSCEKSSELSWTFSVDARVLGGIPEVMVDDVDGTALACVEALVMALDDRRPPRPVACWVVVLLGVALAVLGIVLLQN